MQMGFLSVASLLVTLTLSGNAMSAAAVAITRPFEDKNASKYFWVKGEASESVAKKKAVDLCKSELKKTKSADKNAPCNVVMSDDRHNVYWAVFYSSSGAAFAVGSSGNRQNAIDTAYKECQKRVKDGDECPTTAEEVFFDQGPEQKTVAAAPAGKSCQPPAGRTLRYSDRCYNGDCTRTFENGCQVRFQAPYCYDAFQQKWDWKPNGC